MSNHIKIIDLTPLERERLVKIVRKPSSPQALVMRARIVLMTADGLPVRKISQELRTTRATIRKWKNRYLKYGIFGLHDLSRSGHPRKYDASTCQLIAFKALHPPEGIDHWTVRALAEFLGINRGIVQRTLQQRAIKLH